MLDGDGDPFWRCTTTGDITYDDPTPMASTWTTVPGGVVETKSLGEAIATVGHTGSLLAAWAGWDDDDLGKLVDAIKAAGRCPHLTELNLKYNCISDAGITRLARAAEGNHLPRIEKINLRYNDITDEGASRFAKACMDGHLPNLTELDLSYNYAIGGAGAASFVEAIEPLDGVSRCPKLKAIVCIRTVQSIVPAGQMIAARGHRSAGSVAGWSLLKGRGKWEDEEEGGRQG